METPDQYKDANKSEVLITGGSGMIGRHLTSLLLAKGYKVAHLSRNLIPVTGVTVYKWNPEKQIIDRQAFEGIRYIIHLAGANLGEKRWTKKRKKEIVSSRVDSAQLILDQIKVNPGGITTFISASATGFYGTVTSEEIFTESDPPYSDFLGTTCRLWEEAADKFTRLGIRTVIIRSAVVLEKNDSALSRMLKPAQYGLVLRLGDGHQYMPWIHIDDLCRIYLKAIKDDNMTGAYNAVAPCHTDNNSFMKTVARVIRKPVFLPPLPAILIKSVIGERASVVLEGSRVSCEKIINAGYNFVYPDLENALINVIYHQG